MKMTTTTGKKEHLIKELNFHWNLCKWRGRHIDCVPKKKPDPNSMFYLCRNNGTYYNLMTPNLVKFGILAWCFVLFDMVVTQHFVTCSIKCMAVEENKFWWHSLTLIAANWICRLNEINSLQRISAGKYCCLRSIQSEHFVMNYNVFGSFFRKLLFYRCTAQRTWQKKNSYRRWYTELNAEK